MELLKLNLLKPLEWSTHLADASGMGTLASALESAEHAPDGAETIMSWSIEAIVKDDDDNGPIVWRPLPEPVRVACSGYGSTPAGNISPMDERLESGSYQFTQMRPRASGASARAEELANAIEWFVREAWWTGAQLEGPLFIRLVSEDNDTALQVIRKLG